MVLRIFGKSKHYTH
uniref:Uncharacterized protein n=1 Tax=Arundo donax TaxID=35708 RepID=A0A0A9AS96_ARUDO